MYPRWRSGFRFELERMIARGILHLIGWLFFLATRALLQIARTAWTLGRRLASTVLIPGTIRFTHETIISINTFWRANNWPKLLIVPAEEEWEWAALSGVTWMVLFIGAQWFLAVLRISVGLAYSLAIMFIPPGQLYILILFTVMLGGIAVGMLIYREAGPGSSSFPPGLFD